MILITGGLGSIERGDLLLQRNPGLIRDVRVVEIDRLHAEAFPAALAGLPDRRTGQAFERGVEADRRHDRPCPDLRRDDDLVTDTAAGTPPAPNVTGPWAVVSAYYRDVRSHHYRAAWVLISSGAVTGQTYQQFVAGYACTGAVRVTKLGESGDHVSFALVAANDCTGQSQHYTGTDTVHAGKIVAADVMRTG